MISLEAQIRTKLKRKVNSLRKQGKIPAILYGPRIKKSQPIEVDRKEFEKVYQKVGESSLFPLKVGKDKFQVLIQEVQRDPLNSNPIHIDFYTPSLVEKIRATIPLVFEGEALAIEKLGGTLVKNISEIDVEAKAEDLPSKIKVDISKLKTFKDYIYVKDLEVSEKIKILQKPDEIIAYVAQPEKEKKPKEKEELEK